MEYNLYLKTAPTVEPLTNDDVAYHLRLDDTTAEEDAYLDALIIAARKYCERLQNRAYITQTWELSLPCFPDGVIELPMGNLQSVDSIVYTSSDGTEAIWDPTQYVYSTRGIMGRIAPAYGVSYPSFVPYPLDAVVIEFTCGYGDGATDVPEQIKQAMYYLISHWYENRSPIAEKMSVVAELQFTINALLYQDRIFPM